LSASISFNACETKDVDMHLVVAGASGATGRLVVKQARAAGHLVTAIVRDSGRYNPPPGVVVLQAEVVTDQGLTLPADADAVISALGKRSHQDPAPVCAAGTANLVAAMGRIGVRRLVVVSAVPVLTSGAGEAWWFRHVLRPFVRRRAPGIYADLETMEEIVRGAGPSVDWTIVRPGYLVDREATDYQLVPEANGSTSVCRADLADALVAATTDPSAIGRSYGLRRGGSPRRMSVRAAA
jgi:putative NADH-flavin reductase